MNIVKLYESFVEYMPWYFRFIHPILLNYEDDGIFLNENQIKVLLAVSSHQGIAPAELSRVFMIPKSSLTTIIRSLVDSDLLLREINPQNERNYSLNVTQYGKRVVDNMNKKHEDEFVKLFSSLPPKELESAIQGLSCICRYLSKEAHFV